MPVGEPLADGLRLAIEKCDVCIFIATTRSVKSQWCLAELGAFWGAGKKVIIYLADTKVDKSKLPPQFQGNLRTEDAKQLIEALKKVDVNQVRKTKDGYSTTLGTMKIEVSLGRIEEFDCRAKNCLIALPANEFFDDDCIHDSNSALGAFVQYHFKERITDVQALVKDALVNAPSKKVEKKPREFAFSYGIGKCIFLDCPLSLNLRIAKVAVTTQRADMGLQADATYIFKAVESIHNIMTNNRLTHLHIPILGSGHGGLKKEVSLICMLIALGELYRKPLGHNLKYVNIVVFRRSANDAPSVSEISIKSALDFTNRLFS